MIDRLAIAHAYETALFAGNMKAVAGYFTDDVVYWVAGTPPIGGEWRGRDAVVRAIADREPGLGAADWVTRTSGASGTPPTSASSSRSASAAG